MSDGSGRTVAERKRIGVQQSMNPNKGVVASRHVCVLLVRDSRYSHAALVVAKQLVIFKQNDTPAPSLKS